MSWSFIVFSELMGEAIVRFVDIGGIVDYHCLNFLFKNMITIKISLNLYSNYNIVYVQPLHTKVNC
jgi:hypothetical protein